ncbi:hypothetical protein TTRE_0000224101 [Trichuris trichiura]|uniref:Uncharacterized protein n=1 Tax=Trichuris trichiura TaxID=36087 RepID=A0A077Z0K4_TRITR|nr:hypothetical protein TTRE_0000224101 [Trichuris trichiura]
MEYLPDDQVPQDDCTDQQVYNDSLRTDIELIHSHAELLKQRLTETHNSFQNIQLLIATLEDRLDLAKDFMHTLNNRFEGKDKKINELESRVKEKKVQVEAELQMLRDKVHSLEMEMSSVEQECQADGSKLDETIRQTSESIEEMKTQKERIDRQLIEHNEKIFSLNKERDAAADSVEQQNSLLQESIVELERKQQYLHSIMKRGEEMRAILSSRLTELEQAMLKSEELQHQLTFSEEELNDAAMQNALVFNEVMKTEIENMLTEAEMEKRSLQRKLRHLLSENARSRRHLEISIRSVKELRESISRRLCQTADMQAKLQEVKKVNDSVFAGIEAMENEIMESSTKIEVLSLCYEELNMQRRQKEHENLMLKSDLDKAVARIALTSESLIREKELAESTRLEREAVQTLLKEKEAAIYNKIEGANKAWRDVMKLRQEISVRQLEVTELEEQLKSAEATENMEISQLENEVQRLRKEFEEKERQIKVLQQGSCGEMSEELKDKMSYMQSLEKEVDDSSEQLINLRKRVIETEDSIANLLDDNEHGNLGLVQV